MSKLMGHRSRWHGVLGLYLGLFVEALQATLGRHYTSCQRSFAAVVPLGRAA